MKNIHLSSARLRIRPMESSDLPFFVNLRNKCLKWLHTDNEFSFQETEKWFKETKPNYYIIEIKNKKVGYVRTSNWDLQNQNVYIGADIEPSFRKLGIATEAYKLFLDYFLKQKGFSKVSLEVLDFNSKAISLYKKIGFKEEGRRKHYSKKKSAFVDSIIMSILKKNYV